MKTASFAIFAVVISLMTFYPSSASAHAFVDRAEPKVGAEVSTPPAEVKIWFTQAIERTFSKIRVLDDAGKELDKMDTHVDNADKKLLIVSVEHLPPGTYKVEWSVVSVDTHRTKGDYKFVVK